MANELPPSLGFTPKQLLLWSKGFIAIGVDGELQKLSPSYKPIGKPVKPFPTPIRNATVLNDRLVATWLDSELMLARMAAIDLNSDLIAGVERSELRVRRTLDKAIHPVGTLWSHVLDAEPLAIDSNDTSFTFVLWKKGIYTMTEDAHEKWRSEEPSWTELSKWPRAEETVNVIAKNNVIEIWSRGGGVKKYNLDDGSLSEQNIITIDGFLLSVHHDSNNYLFQLNDGYIAMFDGEKIILKAKLSGPINHATWDENKLGWYISGWREIIFISTNTYQRFEQNEIPVYYDSKMKISLSNDSNWQFALLDEEE